MPSVIFNSGPRTGEKLVIEKDITTFGRHYSCDCELTHPTVSREHFRIERAGGKFLLVDRESGNGTFANGERVSWVELKDGDRIQAGPFMMIFKSDGEPVSRAASKDEASSDNHVDEKHPCFDERHRAVYPREYLEGVEHFNNRRYYDAHEVWEEIWLRSEGETKLFYQMLIQAAVGLHHYERGNARGARGMYKNVVEKIERLPYCFMSLDVADFSRQYKTFFAVLIESGSEAPPPETKPRPLIRLLTADTSA
jgi:uncharacterized protein